MAILLVLMFRSAMYHRVPSFVLRMIFPENRYALFRIMR
jgi:hypothetical protein